MTGRNSQQAIEIAIQHHKSGRLNEAEAMYREILRFEPFHADALHLMGLLAGQVGRSDIAVHLINQAVNAASPSVPSEYLVNLTGIHLARGEALEVEKIASNGLKSDPQSSGLWNNLGNSLYLQGRISEAADSFKSAYDVDQTNAGALSNWANIMQETGRISEAMAAHKLAATLGADKKASEDNYLRDLGFMTDLDPIFVRDQHISWGHEFEKSIDLSLVRSSHANSLDSTRRLKIGLISPDFRLHSVTYFIEPLLRHMDRANFELFCYANVNYPDDTSARLQSYPLQWRNITILSDAKAAALIADDAIDILIDLAGHTSENRCRILALQPAPLQMTYLGYPFSTGLTACRYRISDAITDPVGLTETHYTEELLRLPFSSWCFQPPSFEIPVSPLPALKNGFITFGSFNTYNKINDAVLDAWSQILLRVPHSRLFLKAHGLSDKPIRNQLIARFHDRGIHLSRLRILGREPSPQRHLELYSEIDIALDSFPYNGTTTSCEAMWQGLPIVVLAGNSHVSRVGICLNKCLGLENLIGNDQEQYVDIAVNLAADIPILREMRRTMRQHMSASPLCDQIQFSQHFESLLRQVWQKNCLCNEHKY